jgi:hypothetical protein
MRVLQTGMAIFNSLLRYYFDMTLALAHNVVRCILARLLHYLFLSKKSKWVKSFLIVRIHKFQKVCLVLYGIQVRITTYSRIVVKTVFKGFC